MARLNRLVIAGQVHFVTQVAQPGLRPLEHAADCEAFLQALRRAALEKGVAIQGYTLLPDRYLVLGTPDDVDALGRMTHALSRWFAAAFNKANHRSGPLWRGRHVAAPIGAAHVVDALVYIEQAAVRAGLAGSPLDYRWSSSSHHALGTRDIVIGTATTLWALGNTPFEREAAYKARVLDQLDSGALKLFEQTMTKGWPLGSATELHAWEEESGRRASPKPRGRPRRLTQI